MERIETDPIKRWESIVNSVDKETVPIEVIKKVVFKLQGGKQKTLNLEKLRKNGAEVEELYSILDRYVYENEEHIRNMDFVLDVPNIIEILKEESDEILKGI